MRNLLFIIMISFVFTMLSCSGNDVESPSAPPEPSIEELEAKVIENCNTFRDALLEYKDDNEGYCPVDIHNEINDLGLTVIDYLPDGQLMENPFTGELTEPVYGSAIDPGQIGYHPGFSWGGTIYYIEGYGESSIVAELSNEDEIVAEVIGNCMLVHLAAETFASLNSGIYPNNVGVDTTPDGRTLIDLLPDGILLENPTHLCATEPVDCASANPGETGYMPIIDGGINVGYVITGTGPAAGTTVFTWWTDSTDTCVTINGEDTYCTE